MKNEEYVCLKLVTGEDIIALLDGETERHVTVSFPMQMIRRDIVADGQPVSSTSAHFFYNYADTPTFTFNKNHLVLIKGVHSSIIPFYLKFIDAEDYYDEEDDYADSEEYTAAELDSYVDKLETIVSKGREPKEDKPKKEPIIIRHEGNDTKH